MELSLGTFFVSAPLSDSWEAFTPPHAGVTVGRFLHQLVVAFFSPISIDSIIYGPERLYTSWSTHVKSSHIAMQQDIT